MLEERQERKSGVSERACDGGNTGRQKRDDEERQGGREDKGVGGGEEKGVKGRRE